MRSKTSEAFHILAYIVTVITAVFCMALVSGIAFTWMDATALDSWIKVMVVVIVAVAIAICAAVTMYDMGDYTTREHDDECR